MSDFGQLTSSALGPGPGADVEEHLRVEVGVDLLACRPPAPRVVVGDRRRRLWVARARSRRPGDDVLDPLVELVYLARSLRPRWLSLGVVIRPEELSEPLRLTLHVVTARRTLAGCSIAHRAQAFTVTEELPGWEPPADAPPPLALASTATAALRRVPRGRRHPPHLVIAHLTDLGHHVELAPGGLGPAGT
jgi:hypothetical protein